MNYREVRASEPQSPWEGWVRAFLKLGRFILLLLIVPVVYVWCENPIDTQNAMRVKLEQLKEQRDVLQSDRDKLLRRMEWIKNDNAYLEMAARDRLHLQKEGEFVLRF
ncbi:septum formation initiator family protein [Prosthecobacter sp.]|uniref:FtsB family cell division protein n=1 Tax=Prosthecobacter sp. TaxID=1965333 RepID=UPI002486E177|nr:septum formation initiator family protein [Prosthecobacter sp.]MDI1314419.1 septum formation initiator family protein [Prosthecobacter sp.]